MNRSYTRKPKTTEPSPDSPEGLEIGLADTPLPGGQPHVAIEPVTPDKMTEKPSNPAFTGMMAHGVYAPFTEPAKPNLEVRHERTSVKVDPEPDKKLKTPSPVPVYIVEKAGGSKPLNTFTVMTLSVGTSPLQLAGKDNHRTRIQLLNEDDTNDARFAMTVSDVTAGNAALLKHGATSYTRIDTQSPVWAVALTAPVNVSVIFETEEPGAD